MSDMNNPKILMTAISEIKRDLPQLMGRDAWSVIEPDFEKYLESLRNSKSEHEQLRYCVMLVDQLKNYEPARLRLTELLKPVDVQRTIIKDIVVIAGQIGLPSDEIRKLQDVVSPNQSSRLIVMKKDFSKAKSIKLRNFAFEFAETSELFAGILALINTTVSNNNYLLISAGILLIARSLYKAASVDISEQDASVFWGLICACDKNKTASEKAIMRNVNKVRVGVSLEPLSLENIKNSLIKLSVIGAVKLVKEATPKWQPVERIKSPSMR